MDDANSPVEAEVRSWRGAPTLFINGRPDPAIMFYHNDVSKGREEIADFAAAGINLVTAPIIGTGSLCRDGSLDTRVFEENMACILSANPSALVMPRFGLFPPKWWSESHPSEMMVYYDPFLGRDVYSEYACPAFSSEAWRTDMSAAMRRLLALCEERHGGRIFGYHLCAGECGEWSYSWRHYTQSDYSPAHLNAFRLWLRRRYGNSRGLLAEAWQTPGLDFDCVEIPRDWRKRPGGSCLLDPTQDRALADYLEFHSWAVADAACFFAAEARAELRRLGRRKIIAVFYGYHFPPPGQSSAFFNSGHHAFGKVAGSPDIDAVCAPYSYFGREAGGAYFSQLTAGSARLHGKLYLSEDDTVTHVSKPVPYRYNCPDLSASVNVIRRNIIGSLLDGGSSWYMDWFGANWYRDRELMRSFAANQRLAEQRLRDDSASVAQILAVVSQTTAWSLWHDGSLLDFWAIRPMLELSRIGAPFSVIDASDLGLFLGSDQGRDCRLVVFLDVPRLNAEEMLAVRNFAAAHGRFVLWTYAPGILAKASLSAEAVSELMGIRVEFGKAEGPVVQTEVTGERIEYGPDHPVAPVLVGSDAEAEVLGSLKGSGAPGLLRRKFDGHTAIWSAAPCVPASVLRFFARQAGAHIYSDAGDQVMAGGALVMLHAASDGKRTIRLRRRCRAVDAFTSETVAEDSDRFDIVLNAGDTRVWMLL